MVINVIFTYNPFDWHFLYEEGFWTFEVQLPMQWKHSIMLIVVVNTVATIAWEKVVVEQVTELSKRYKKSNKKMLAKHEQ